jgi:hypothetical protein
MTTPAQVTAKELEFILALRSNDPAIGYNDTTAGPKEKICLKNL